jgi:hypothetical protein
MEKTDMPSELEMLAGAGFHFREEYAEKIKYAEVDTNLPFPGICLYADGPYILGPEKGEKLLVVRDIFNKIGTSDLSQTKIPGVIQIITQHSTMMGIGKSKNMAGYIIHMLPHTMPKDIDWKTFDLKTYNRLREEYYR